MSNTNDEFLLGTFQCVFLLWCMSPLEGSTTIYNKVIRPYFLKHQSAIDDVVKKGTDKISGFAGDALEKGNEHFIGPN